MTKRRREGEKRGMKISDVKERERALTGPIHGHTCTDTLTHKYTYMCISLLSRSPYTYASTTAYMYACVYFNAKDILFTFKSFPRRTIKHCRDMSAENPFGITDSCWIIETWS